MDHSYLVSATNEMFSILSRSLEPSQLELCEAFAVGCMTLRRLRKDEEFFKAANLLRKHRNANRKDFTAIITDVNHFTQGFLVIERKAMLAAGISVASWEYLARCTEGIRDRIARAPFKFEDLTIAISKLRKIVREIADELQEAEVKADRRGRIQNAFGKMVLGIGGAAMIGVNASALAATVGLSPAGSAVSAAVGVGMVIRPSNESNPIRGLEPTIPRPQLQVVCAIPCPGENGVGQTANWVTAAAFDDEAAPRAWGR